MPFRPVTAYAVGITPAHTVIAAIDASRNASTDQTPSRSLASARGTVLARGEGIVRGISNAPSFKDVRDNRFTCGEKGPMRYRRRPGCGRSAAAGPAGDG